MLMFECFSDEFAIQIGEEQNNRWNRLQCGLVLGPPES